MEIGVMYHAPLTGSVQKKKGRRYYSAVINMPDADGVRKPKWFPTKCERKAEAQQALRQLLEYHENAERPIAEAKPLQELRHKRMDFAEFMEQWLENSASHAVAPTTVEGYRFNVNLHIVPYFRKHPVSIGDITHVHIQQYITDRCTNGGLNPKTVKKHVSNMSSAFTCAMRSNILDANPCLAIRYEYPYVPKFMGTPLKPTQLHSILEEAKGKPYETAFMLTIFYGLRRSEVLGLKWRSVDLEGDTLLIQDATVRISTKVEKDTKNEASTGTLPLLPAVKEHLLALKEQQRTNRETFGQDYVCSDLVCAWPSGEPFGCSYLNDVLRRVLKRLDIPNVRFHDLRHSCATYLLGLGVSIKEIQIWLRHSDITTTMNLYTHVDTSMKIETGKKITEKFGSLA